jgi:alkanesulfonate monooxygenase SsuD/methylene tetrahydromethanopterin reductase-like flavin-dependent oxidoreductase (luciferase family)
MIATLDVLSGGRANCGLGIGWDADEHAMVGLDLPPPSTRYELLEETLEMLPLLWGKGTPEFHGTHIDSTALTCYPRPIQEHIPLLIGGSGERRTLALVARFADACNVFGDPDRVRHKVEVLHRHCAGVDRDPGEIEITHLTNALVAPDRGTLRDKVEDLRDRNTTPESYLSRANGGTVDDLETLFRAYAAAGAGHSIVSMPDVSRPGSLETFADVIARFGSP